jgi:hypothetical protein
MPLIIFTLLNFAVGVAASLWSSRELRASPRAIVSLSGFAAVAAHGALVAVPAMFYLLMRHTDWMVSYVIHGGRVPSAVWLMVAGVQCVVALTGFALGAREVRDHHHRRPVVLLSIVGALVMAVFFVGRGRIGVVGNVAQFRGGFGMVPFWASRVSSSVMVIAVAQGAALVHLARTLRGATL